MYRGSQLCHNVPQLPFQLLSDQHDSHKILSDSVVSLHILLCPEIIIDTYSVFASDDAIISENAGMDMDEFNKETSGLKLRARAEQIRLLSERIDQAHKTPPDQLFALFDELIGCYREDRNSSPEPSDEVNLSVAKSLMRVFSYIRASSDIAAFEKYSPMFDELEPTLQNPLEKARIFQTFGFLFWLKNDMDASIRYLKESLKILNDNEIDDDIPERYTNLGYVYEYLGDYRKAEKIYQEGLNYGKKHNYEAALIQASSGMGRLNLRLKRYKTAIKYLERNLDLVDEKIRSLREPPSSPTWPMHI